MDATGYSRPPFLTAEDVKDGDVIVFKSDARVSEFKNGNTGLTFDVDLDGIVMPFTPFGSIITVLIRAWGKETKDWVGRKAEISIREYASASGTGKAIELTPLDDKEKAVEPNPEVKDEDIPVIDPDTDDPAKKSKDGINVEDVPF